MQFPSKVTRYNQSTIPSFLKILSIIEENDISILELYKKVKKSVDTYNFILIIDSLYSLGKIEFNSESEVIHYVKDDIM